jgi:hypothetical protein
VCVCVRERESRRERERERERERNASAIEAAYARGFPAAFLKPGYPTQFDWIPYHNC